MNAASLRLVPVLALLSLAASRMDAQRIGAHLGYNFDVEEVLLGAQGTWPITPVVALYPSFDYYFVDPGSLWSLNVDVKFRPPSRSGALYVGGGFNYSRASFAGNSASDNGFNLLVGLEGRRTRSTPYVEAKIILGDGNSFQIVGGFTFR
jgi:hypothetical protein